MEPEPPVPPWLEPNVPSPGSARRRSKGNQMTELTSPLTDQQLNEAGRLTDGRPGAALVSTT